ncbi:hypothetical protein GFB56_36645 [Ensifer sp. T173]|jgi:hypothetical protein|uniref:Uncharacterized protein n=1 Tax=Ensifer canadensis TaxID=555315 RepID=A0AAW4FXW6_9HYPH|nr:hypothetical protein [Ensifer canadensis]MBM3096188.1 hypothetical protein [Ensifer canadensis]UBI77818.1 hypothetical protein J3R84_25050 [Ensifer canadensis]
MKDTTDPSFVSTNAPALPRPSVLTSAPGRTASPSGPKDFTAFKRAFGPDDVGAGPSTAIGGPAFSPSTQIERENHEQN